MDFKFENYYDDGTTIWIVPQESVGLYRLDKETRMLDLVNVIPKEYQKRGLFYGIALYEEKIFLIPYKTEQLLIYDLTSKQWESISFPTIKTENEISNQTYFMSGIVYEHYIYMFGYSTPVILRFDMVTSTFELKSDISKDYTISINDKEDGFFHVSYLCLDNKIYYPFMNSNSVLEFNLATNESEIHRVGEKGDRFISIAYDGMDCWLIPRAEGNIVKWNVYTKEEHYYHDYPVGFENQKYSLYRSVYLDGHIWVFRHMGNMNLKINVSTGEMTEFHLPYDDVKIPGCRYPVVKLDNKVIRIHPKDHEEWIEFDPMMNAIQKYNFQKSELCRDLELKYSILTKQKKGYLMEGNDCSLTDYLKVCLVSEEGPHQAQDENFGAKIHEFIKSSL